jgi:polyisoprenoid-binding protein YceI
MKTRESNPFAHLVPPAPAAAHRGRRRPLLLAGFGLLTLTLGGCGLFDDAPEEVSIEDAAENAKGGTEGTGQDDSGSEQASVEGEWTIDTETGEFDFETATGTFAGFRVDEELSSLGSTTAVGRTGDVEGEMTIGDSALEQATFTVDMTTITTNENRRDSRVQEALETSTFPDATFTLTSPVDFDVETPAGETISIDAPGTLTIHGVDKEVIFPLEAQRVEDRIVVVGSLDILLSDFGVDAPKAPIVLSVSDTATIEFNLLFNRAS